MNKVSCAVLVEIPLSILLLYNFSYRKWTVCIQEMLITLTEQNIILLNVYSTKVITWLCTLLCMKKKIWIFKNRVQVDTKSKYEGNWYMTKNRCKFWPNLFRTFQILKLFTLKVRIGGSFVFTMSRRSFWPNFRVVWLPKMPASGWGSLWQSSSFVPWFVLNAFRDISGVVPEWPWISGFMRMSSFTWVKWVGNVSLYRKYP